MTVGVGRAAGMITRFSCQAIIGPATTLVFLSVAKVVARRSELPRKERHTHLNGTILWPATNHSLQP